MVDVILKLGCSLEASGSHHNTNYTYPDIIYVGGATVDSPRYKHTPPQVPGVHNVDVKYNGLSINGSPALIDIKSLPQVTFLT